ncbi:hypothetical protein K7432_004949 [Basidiobolus ranarum]|uniref:Serpin domain-containing protein n=1 Tax=Basidiobolus ranarum TaxID=34480 RepID=A0ABR2W3U4_9FUNG
MFANEQDSPCFIELESQEEILFKAIQSISESLVNSLDPSKEANVLFSPTSVLFALLLLVNGTSQEAESRKEILNAFKFDLLEKNSTQCLDDVNNAVQALLNELLNRDGSINLSKDRLADFEVANSVWGDKIRQTYTAQVKELFTAEAFPSPENGKRVNTWIEEKTKGHLKNFFSDEQPFPNDTIMLINSVYFHGRWLFPFNPEDTIISSFSTPSGKQIDASMMHIEGKTWAYCERENYQVLNIPYKDYRFMATIVLPKEVLDFEKANEIMNPEEWKRVFLERKMKSPGTVILPKFDVERQVELSKAFKNMGIKKVFDAGQAKLSEMTEEPLAVDGVLHKCRIEVEEAGSKASAATAIILTRSVMILGPPFHFECNRPFYFIISTNRGIPLFMSYIQTPSS